MPPVAAAALSAVSLDDAGKWVCLATPIELRAGMTNVVMPAAGIVQLSPGESAALAGDFNRVFGGAEVRMTVGRAATLLCIFDRALEAATVDPEAVAGGDVFAFQPAGIDAARLRRLASEIEMWLFEHEVNRRRAGVSLQPVTGLWLWGGGATIAAPPAVRGWTAGEDPFFAAFGDARRFSGDAGSGVMVSREYPGSPAWNEVETHWLAPAVDALKRGGIQRLELSAGAKRWSLERHWNLRFWRRTQPWWESFDLNVSASNVLQ